MSAYPSGTPWAIPGSIGFWEYDRGGEGVGYHKGTACSNTVRNDTTAIGTSGDGTGEYDLGRNLVGDWYDYTVAAPLTGLYAFSIRYSNGSGLNGALHIQDETGTKLASVTIPATGGWGTYATVTGSLTMMAGTHTLRFVSDTSNADNLTWFALVPPTSPEAAISSDAFVDTIGVNTHLSQAPYSTPVVLSAIEALGVRHIRDGFVDNPPASYIATLTALANAGVKFNLITSVWELLPSIESYPAQLPAGAIESIEYPNELENYDSTWLVDEHVNGPPLWQAVQTNPALAGIKVMGPSLTSEADQASLGDMSAYLDYGNMHAYSPGFEPGAGWGGAELGSTYGTIVANMRSTALTSGDKPIIATETGYGVAATPQHTLVPAWVQCRYAIRTFLLYFMAGCVKTYWYQFMDQGTQGQGDGYFTFGLCNTDGSAKPAYKALQGLISRLADKTDPQAPGTLSWALTGNTGNVQHLVMRKTGSAYIVALWIDAPCWDPNGGGTGQPGAPLTVNPQAVNVTIPATATITGADTFDDTGTWAAATVGPYGAITLTDRPTLMYVNAP